MLHRRTEQIPAADRASPLICENLSTNAGCDLWKIAFACARPEFVNTVSHKNFWLLNPNSGAERQLTDLPANFRIGDFDISADGKEIIFDHMQDDNSSIALIERTR